MAIYCFKELCWNILVHQHEGPQYENTSKSAHNIIILESPFMVYLAAENQASRKPIQRGLDLGSSKKSHWFLSAFMQLQAQVPFLKIKAERVTTKFGGGGGGLSERVSLLWLLQSFTS